MTAEVEIMAESISSVIALPVQALVQREGQHYCYVLPRNSKTPEIRRVEVGASNDKVVAIENAGLKAGEVVIQNLTAVIDEEELGARAKEDAEKYKVEAPVVVAKKQVPAGGVGNGNGNTANAGAAPTGDGIAAKKGAGGGGSRMLDQYDTNKDGKITIADEVPEDRRGFLTRMDTNSDGVIDAAELAALAARGRQSGGGGAPGAGGPGGFTMPATGAEWIKTSDKNGDGKVAKDELPEFAQGFFGTMDTSGDGFVDGAEADALIERMKQMQQQGGFGGGAGGPPGR
jgi:Ca2+-binding EF-hand superfamily protein